MTTRVRSALARGTASQAAAELASQLQPSGSGETPALIFAFGSLQQPLDILLPELAARFPGSTVLGASTAGEFTERGDTKDAACALALSGEYRVFAGIGAGLAADPERALARAIEGQPMELQGYPHRSAVLLLDPLAGNGEETTLLASALLGDNVLLAGGAAGDYLAMKQTLVGCGSRVASDAVVIAQIFSKRPLGIGISHGHRAISEPVRVTSSQGNTVQTIDDRPAWDVWRERTARAAAQRGIDVSKLSAEEIPGFLLQYEAGLSVGAEIKIRAPLSLGEGGAIHFACGIPKGTVFRVTESEPERQIASAREAARRALERLAGAKPAGAVVFDCICRNLILGERFGTAVRAISEELGQVPIAGFETYGEIALDVGDMSGFHNTTSVVLAFPEE
jgi:methyl-accepting chemotaxis protein